MEILFGIVKSRYVACCVDILCKLLLCECKMSLLSNKMWSNCSSGSRHVVNDALTPQLNENILQ